MKTIGIIAEFNPFHNGHKYLIDKARQELDADRVIILTSGNFVQRGGPAFFNKYVRTEMAIQNGVDLVIELPFCYANASASYFAYGAVSILNSIGVVDYLAFGIDFSNQNSIVKISNILANEPEAYKASLKKYLKDGISFSRSREKALIDYLNSDNESSTLKKIEILKDIENGILSKPNTILALEYLMWLNRTHSQIQPHMISRIDSGYHSINISGEFSSATAIRQNVNKDNFFYNCVPKNCHKYYQTDSSNNSVSSINSCNNIELNDFSQMFIYKLFSESFFSKKRFDGVNNSTPEYFDVSPEFLNRMVNKLNKFTNLETFISDCNSPIFTNAYCRRAVFNILAGYTKEDYELFKENGGALYCKLLGFKKESADLFSEIKKKSVIPFISKLANAGNHLSKPANRMLAINLYMDSLYNHLLMNKYGACFPNEMQQKIRQI